MPSILLVATLAAAQSRPASAPAWRTKGIAASTTIDLSKLQPDAGMRATPAGEGLVLGLDGVPYSNVELTQRLPYHPHDAVRLELPELKGASVSLQAVCYDAAGKVTGYVDLLEYIEQPGSFEVPLWIYRTPLKGAEQIGFRIWLAGNHPGATVGSVTYGTAGK